MANGVPLTLIIPTESNVRFDQWELGVTASRPVDGGVALTISADRIERLAPHPIDRPAWYRARRKPRPRWVPRWLWGALGG